MGRMYTANFEAVAITALQDLFEVLAASGKPFILHKIELCQTTELGDAAEEILRIQIKRATSGYTSGSGGSTATLQKHATNDAAAGPTPEINNTTQAVAGGGALVVLDGAQMWNVRTPFIYLPTPENRFLFLPGEACIVSTPANPTDSITASGSITIEEL